MQNLFLKPMTNIKNNTS